MDPAAPVTLLWLRSDLRVADNPALAEAFVAGTPVVALYIHETDASLRPLGAAARWWRHLSLQDLAASLARLGVPLEVQTGPAMAAVMAAVMRHKAASVVWNRRYGRAERELDSGIKVALRGAGVSATSCSSHLLVEPFDIATGAGRPYSVFTPFWRTLRQRPIARPLPAPVPRFADAGPTAGVDADYAAAPWTRKLAQHWTVGEAAAQQALRDFLARKLTQYADGRDRPAEDVTSRLAPHLAHGEISPRQIWHATLAWAAAHPQLAATAEKFLSELAWRDFAYHLLYHRDDIARVPMQARFADVDWRSDAEALRRWQRGLTGIPIVDAGMRELWQTGTMHNRVRMLTASLLSKNLLLDWRLGEAWFWDTLVDADPASNPMNWQWVAGCGADAAPYFRIFNPVTQGQKIDPDGLYVRRWLPELKRLAPRWLHQPAAAPTPVLTAAGIRLGETYPAPLVDLAESRKRALAALAAR